MYPLKRILPAMALFMVLLAVLGCANALNLPEGQTSQVPVVFDDPSEILPYLPPNETPEPSLAPTLRPSPRPTLKPTPAPSLGPGTVPSASPGSQTDLPPDGLTRDNILKVQSTPTGPEGFSFIFMGDSRNATPFTGDGDETYTRTVEVVNRQGALFVVHGGDFTFDNLQRHWKKVVEIQDRLVPPLLTVVGNHDVLFRRTFYEGTFVAPNPKTGLDDYSFDYGPVRFIAVDNANFTITDNQFTWLEDQLRTNRVKIVFTHAPPSLGNWEKHSMRDAKSSERFVQFMDGARVNMVLVSHIHLYDDSIRRGNTQYILSGGAGAPLSPLQFGVRTHHVVLIRVGPDGKLTYRMVPVT